jgi:transcriptional regulator with XRE-family HTH domain
MMEPMARASKKPPLQAALGLAVRELRSRSELTQKALAEKAGLNPSYLSEVENGKRNLTWAAIINLADALKAQPSELVVEAERLAGRATSRPS